MRRRGATPGKGQRHKQPRRGCADGSNGWHVLCVHCVDIGNPFMADSSSAPANTIPFRPCLSHPPGGHERHNPLRGRERDVAWTRGSASAAQPRASWQNPVGIPGGGWGNMRPSDSRRENGDRPTLGVSMHIMGHRPHHFPAPNVNDVVPYSPGLCGFAALSMNWIVFRVVNSCWS